MYKTKISDLSTASSPRPNLLGTVWSFVILDRDWSPQAGYLDELTSRPSLLHMKDTRQFADRVSGRSWTRVSPSVLNARWNRVLLLILTRVQVCQYSCFLSRLP